MIFPFSQMMVEKERGRLCSIQRDGSDSVPFIIKNDKLLIGRGDTCEIRIYVDGVEPEHCIISFNEEGRGFIEAVNKCGLVFLNGETIERQISLEHSDVITVVKRSFRFFYPPSSKFFVSPQPTTSIQENEDEELCEFDPEDVCIFKEEENLERRVTFGPRLSPEEFDRNMPPATPLRKGSLPSDKLKSKTPCSAQDFTKSHFKKNLFKNSPLPKPDSLNEQLSSETEMPKSRIILQKLRCSDTAKIDQRRPLFSEVVKKTAGNPPKNVIKRALLKYSPERFTKRSLKLKDSRSKFYNSPKKPINPRIAAVTSTGHANSPETIIICKKRHPTKNSLSVQKRKSLRLSHRSSTAEITSDEPKSKSFGEANSNNMLSSQNDSPSENHDLNVGSHTKTQNNNKTTPVPEKLSTPPPVKHIKKKKSLSGNEASTPVPIEGTSSEENDETNTPQRKSSRNTLAKDSSSRKSGSKKSENIVIFNEDSDVEFEEEQSIAENNENEVESSASSLVAAINNVSEIDGNSIDKSMKDIHNAVEALCHSNVSALSNDSSSDEMCDNAIKKLALTISMISAFRTYNRIIDDVSPFSLSFPGTSFENPADNMRCIPTNAVRHNDNFVRISWFQDIMRNFFSNCNDYNGGKRSMLRTHEDDLCSSTSSHVATKKSKSTSAVSKNDSSKTVTPRGKTNKRKFACSHDDLEWENNESSNFDNKHVCKECGLDVRPSYMRKSPRTSLTSSATIPVTKTTRSSFSSNKEDSDPVARKSTSQKFSKLFNLEAGQSRTSKKSFDSVGKKNIEKPAVESPTTSLSSNTTVSSSKTTRSSVSRKSIENIAETSLRASLPSNTEIPVMKTTRTSVSRKSIEKPAVTSLMQNTTVSVLKTARSSVGRKSVEKPVVISSRRSLSGSTGMPVLKTRSSVSRKSIENTAAASPRSSLSSNTTVPVSKTKRSSSSKEASPSLAKRSQNLTISPALQFAESRAYKEGSVDPDSRKSIDKPTGQVSSSVFLAKSSSSYISSSPLKKAVKLRDRISLLPSSARKLRIQNFKLLKGKSQKTELGTRRLPIAIPKRLKAQKKEYKHRRDVLEKVKFRVMSPFKKSSPVSMKFRRVSLKRTENTNFQCKPELKIRKMSSEKFEKPKMNLSKSPMTNKLSPKLLRKRAEKRKSVLYKRKGLTKKSSLAKKIPSIRNSVVMITPLSETEDNKGKKGKKKTSKEINENMTVRKLRSNRKDIKDKIASEAVSSESRESTRKNKRGVHSTATEIEGSPIILDEFMTEELKSNRRNKREQFLSKAVSSATKTTMRKNKRGVQSTASEIGGCPIVSETKENMTEELKSYTRNKKDQSSTSKKRTRKNREAIQSTTEETEESSIIPEKKGIHNRRKRGRKISETTVELAVYEKKNSPILENSIQIKDVIDSPKLRQRTGKIQSKELNPEQVNSPIMESAVKTRRKKNAVSNQGKELNDIKSPEKERGKRKKVTTKANKSSKTAEKTNEIVEISPKSKKEEKKVQSNVTDKDIKTSGKESGKRKKIAKKAIKNSETAEKFNEVVEISPKSKKEESNVTKKDNKNPEKGGAKKRRKNIKDSENPETTQEIKNTAKNEKEQKTVTKRGREKKEKKTVQTEVSPRITRSLRSRK